MFRRAAERNGTPSSTDDEDTTAGEVSTHMDPLNMHHRPRLQVVGADDDYQQPLPQVAHRGLSPDYHAIDVRQERCVPISRLPSLPQWGPGLAYAHSFHFPQWDTGVTDGSAAASTAAQPHHTSASPRPPMQQQGQGQGVATDVRTEGVHPHAVALSGFTCADCKFVKERCVCTKCRLCTASLAFPGRRHHCRRCWAAVCTDCRLRYRYTNAMAWFDTRQLVCDTCAVLGGLAHLTENESFVGIELLKAAMDAPLQCVDREGCGAYTYRLSCPACSLPTVPSRAHVERLVRVNLCCTMGRMCARCASAEQRMQEHERRVEQRRYDRFAGQTPADVEAVWRSGHNLGHRLAAASSSSAAGAVFGNAFKWLDDTRTKDVVLALVSSSVCYEYAAFPHTTLELSDVPPARELLRLRECKQDYSILDGPGDILVLAFAGTHDLRTALTDLKFARTTERQFTTINEGLARSDPSQPYRRVCGGVQQLWLYRKHEGFSTAEAGLRKSISTSTIRGYVSSGKRLLICGHSLGGALATLVTLRLLEEDLHTFGNGKVTCITFGAPLVGNSGLAAKVRACGWTDYFLHFVYRSDVVPRLLTERDAHRFLAYNVKTAVSAAVQWIKGNAPDAGKQQQQQQQPNSHGTEMTANIAELAAADVPRSLHSTATAATGCDSSADGLDSNDVVANPSSFTSAATLAQRRRAAAYTATEEDDDEDGGGLDEGFAPPHLSKVIEKRAYECFGQYHMLQRNVPYKATRNHLVAYHAMRSGDGLKVEISDHLLDSYMRGIATQLRVLSHQNRASR